MHHWSNTYLRSQRGSASAYQNSALVLHAGMGVSADVMRFDPASLPNYSDQQPGYAANRIAQVAASVVHQNDHSDPPASLLNAASFNLNPELMGMQFQGDGNIDWNNMQSPFSWLYCVDQGSESVRVLLPGQNGDSSTANATVPPTKNTIDDKTDDVYTSGTQGTAPRNFNDWKGDDQFNSSWNMLNGQAFKRNEGSSDLTSWAPFLSPFDVQFTSLSISGQATGSGMPLMESKPVFINAEQKAQETRPQLRRRGKDRKGTDIFPCKECKVTFKGQYELTRHLNQTKKHGGPKFKCARCGDLLSRPDALEKHMSNPRACRVK